MIQISTKSLIRVENVAKTFVQDKKNSPFLALPLVCCTESPELNATLLIVSDRNLYGSKTVTY